MRRRFVDALGSLRSAPLNPRARGKTVVVVCIAGGLLSSPLPNRSADAGQAKPQRAEVVAPAIQGSHPRGEACGQKDLIRRRVQTVISPAPAFIQPRILATALIAFDVGTTLPVEEVVHDWIRVRFDDRRWGSRVGYLHCSHVRIVADSPSPLAVSRSSNEPTPRSSTAKPASAPKPSEPLPRKASKKVVPARVNGYLEWRRDDHLIVEGQRLTWDARTKIRNKEFVSFDAVPLGSEVMARGVRLEDGTVLAREIQVKPNGTALYEREVREQSAAAEDAMRRDGHWLQFGPKNQLQRRAPLVTQGPEYARVRAILDRILPPYLDANDARVYVVESDDWNAFAAPNGAIFVHTPLLRDTDDDELAFVLGHEIAHYTHEHVRRREKQAAWGRLAAAGAQAAIQTIDDHATQDVVSQLAVLGLHAWQNGYSRANEDQADRVGLRYAYEAGFDVRQAVRIWQRARARDGEFDRVTNFFYGSHSRPTERIRNIERQLQLNYSSARSTEGGAR